MFSYLRSHHKRTGSTPTSPDVSAPPPFPKSPNDALPLPSPDNFAYQHFQNQSDQGSLHVQSPASDYTPVSPIPPILPPIPRVASQVNRRKRSSERANVERGSLERSFNEATGHTQNNGYSRGKRRSEESGHSEHRPDEQRVGYMQEERRGGYWQEERRAAYVQDEHQGGYLQEQLLPVQPFQKVDRAQMNRRLHTSSPAAPTGLRSRGQSAQVQDHAAGNFRGTSTAAPIVQLQEPTYHTVEHASFARTLPLSPQPQHPTQLQPTLSNSASEFLSVPYDEARPHTPPIKRAVPGKPPTPPPPTIPGQKPKTKLNLRNPMSLLLRRRSGQPLDPLQVPDENLLLGLNKSKLPDNYDPRIMGTRVHDFSAPRPPPKRFYTTPHQPGIIIDGGERAPGDKSTHGLEKRKSESPPRPKRAHTPTFVEHFDDDENTERAVRAEELANKDFLSRNTLMPPGEDNMPMPPFGRLSFGQLSPDPGPTIVEDTIFEEEDLGTASKPMPEPPSRTPPIPPSLAPLGPSPNETAVSSITATPEHMTKHAPRRSTDNRTSSAPSPPRRRTRTSVTGLPAHMTSNASRFSFQFGGPEAQLQEKILEERHKAKQAERDMASKMRQDEDDWAEDEDAYDDYDDNGMYEEPIPGVNADFGGDGFDDGFSLPDGMMPMGMGNRISTGIGNVKLREDNPLGTTDIVAAARLALSSNPPSPADYSPASLDARSMRLPSNASARPSIDSRPSFDSRRMVKLGSSTSESLDGSRRRSADTSRDPLPEEEETYSMVDEEDEEEAPEPEAARPAFAAVTKVLDDDLYFDDGLIQIPGDEEEPTHFDESVFDDPSNPLYERPLVDRRPHGTIVGERDSAEPSPEQRRATSLESNAGPLGGVPETVGDPQRKSHASEFENLNAYHNALAEAATKAAADGRFMRQGSIPHSLHSSVELPRFSNASSETSDADKSKLSALESSAQSLVQDNVRLSDSSLSQGPARTSGSSEDNFKAMAKAGVLAYSGLGLSDTAGSAYPSDPPSYEFDTGFDDYDFDDPIIAAANAEALANDDEGEYGREFGFYAAPPPGGPLTVVCSNLNGGDAASVSGSEDGSEVEFVNGGYFGPKGVDTVGRNKSLREPNLTPITERSEYSTRNSMVSLFGLSSSAGQLAVSAGVTPISAGPISSPGLAELAKISQYSLDDDDMSMEKLMKLRTRTFGDGPRGSISDQSAASSSSPRNSSPITQTNPYLLPRGAQIQHPGQHPTMGWLNGVGVGVSGVDGLERLGEDDESSTDDDVDVEGEADSDYESDGVAEDRVYDDGDSTMPDSPTITGTDSNALSSSPVPTASPPSSHPTLTQSPPLGFFNTNNAPPSPPNAGHFFDPQTPTSTQSTHSPTTALRSSAAANVVKTFPQIPSSPSPMVRHAPSLPHSPAHSRNSSQNESGVTVAYVRERDDSVEGGQRWVLERRRTGEAGQVHILGREVVTGGRI